MATAGPKHTKTTQYFSCKRFVEMTPEHRFAELQKKGFCFQCLYPGSHKNTKVAIFVANTKMLTVKKILCIHANHDKFPRKKHVLVFEEDSQSNEKRGC